MSDTDDSHPVLTAVGVIAAAAGVLMVVEPGLAAAIGTDYVAVTVVGLLAFVQAVRVARARQKSRLRAAETPDVETVRTMPTPGDSFDRRVAELGGGPRRVLIRERANLRETLVEAAVTAVADRENCSRTEAERRVEAGTWTDDPHAAAYLGGADAPSPPLLDRIKLAASARSPFQFRIRRTADAVARVAGVTADGDATADSSAYGPDGSPEREVGGSPERKTDASAVGGLIGSTVARLTGSSERRATETPDEPPETDGSERATAADERETDEAADPTEAER